MSSTAMGHKTPLTRDEDFYFEDGSCILQVRDRLFNLHRSILSVNSGFFKQMFSLPQPTSDQSGQSGGDPIQCDDSVEDFRALCHTLYCNLTEPGPEPGTLDAPAMLRIARVASLAHKYEFTGIQKWAHKILSGSGCPMKSLSFDEVAVTLEVALECSWEDISTKLEVCLLRDLVQDTDKSSLETASKLGLILNLAERYKRISLQAKAYHKYLQTIKWSFHFTKLQGDPFSVQTIAETSTSFHSLSALNDSQKLRLFRGFVQLSSLKDHLQYPPLFAHNESGCIARGLQHRCGKAIGKTWALISGIPGVGAIEILNAAPDLLVRFKEKDTSLECVLALNQEIASLRQKASLALPEYFGLKESR